MLTAGQLLDKPRRKKAVQQLARFGYYHHGCLVAVKTAIGSLLVKCHHRCLCGFWWNFKVRNFLENLILNVML